MAGPTDTGPGPTKAKVGDATGGGSTTPNLTDPDNDDYVGATNSSSSPGTKRTKQEKQEEKKAQQEADSARRGNDPGVRREAFPAFHFEVVIDGTAYPFRSCSGLKSETKPFTVEEGGVNTHLHQLVGQTTFPPLVLKQGFCNASSELYGLYLNFCITEADPGAKQADPLKPTRAKKRFQGYVRQIGPNGTSAKWTFKRAWISKWEGPDLDATKNEVSIESIEIVHEGLYLIGSGDGPMVDPKKKGLKVGLF